MNQPRCDGVVRNIALPHARTTNRPTLPNWCQHKSLQSQTFQLLRDLHMQLLGSFNSTLLWKKQVCLHSRRTGVKFSMACHIVGIVAAFPLVNSRMHIQQTNTPRADQATVRTQFDLTSRWCVAASNDFDSRWWKGTCQKSVDAQIKTTSSTPQITASIGIAAGQIHNNDTDVTASVDIRGATTRPARC